MEIVEYVIKHQGRYIIENDQVGLYDRTVDIDKATVFPTVKNTIKFVQDDMKLNIANVDVIKLVTSVTESVVEL